MMTMNIKRIIGITCLLLLLFSILLPCVQYQLKTKPEDHLRLEVIPSGEGWGYQINADQKVMIKQPHIPGLSTVRPFATKQDAKVIGSLVLKRIRHQQDFTVTADDLKLYRIQ
ncbi:DUF4907 domain-containing protein [Parabacteroides pacaensis]|uniref:DUF4907 domain-containing protein n=1 Tax=Parabacteroides pacaensis TaxID=2086575 RepID=UPI00131D7283|nr:DUF4907 domain-containing protein [Parabacteroides pacaensis]